MNQNYFKWSDRLKKRQIKIFFHLIFLHYTFENYHFLAKWKIQQRKRALWSNRSCTCSTLQLKTPPTTESKWREKQSNRSWSSHIYALSFSFPSTSLEESLMAVPVEEAIAALSTFSLEVPIFCYIFLTSFATKFEMRLWIVLFSLLQFGPI